MKLTSLFLFVCISNIIFSQTFLMKRPKSDKTEINISVLHPYTDNKDDYGDNNDISAFSGIYNFELKTPINNKLSFEAILGYSTFSAKINRSSWSVNGLHWYEESKTYSTITNLYLGIQMGKPDKNISTSFGIILPTASEDKGEALAYAILADAYHIERYVPNLYGVSASVNFMRDIDKVVSLGFELGPDLFITTKKESDSHCFAHFGLNAAVHIEQLSLIGEFTGKLAISENPDDFSDRFINSLQIGANYRFDRFMPRVFYKIEFNNSVKSIIDNSLGLGMQITI